MFRLLFYLMAGLGFIIISVGFLDLGKTNPLDSFDTQLFEYGFSAVLLITGLGLIALGFLNS